LGAVGQAYNEARPFVSVRSCGAFASSTRVKGSLLVCLLLLVVVTLNQWPLLFGQTPPSARLHVYQDSWTFKDGAPADVTCLAQTNDGFLWLGGPNGLFRFEGTRFEPFRSQFGDRLLSTHLYSLFGPPSGGLWAGYVLGGFSFLNNGRVTNYGGEIASSTGSVFGFAQDRDGIVWAATASGLWRFDHLSWQPIGVEWNAPAGSVTKVGFDQKGILWALAGSFGAQMDLIYLLPGTRHFKTAERNLSVEGFMLDADRAVITDPAARPVSDSSEGSEEKPAAYPVLTKGSQQLLDRNKSLWISYDDKPIVMRLPKESLGGDLNRASPAGSESYDIYPFEMAQMVDREGNIWFGDNKGIHRFSYSPLNRQEFPKDALGNLDFAVAPDDNGAVWITSRTDIPKANLYYVSGGKAQLRLPQVISAFAYRAPDRTLWFSGAGCLWHLVGHDFVRVNLPREMANQFYSLQTITGDQQGRIWVSFGRHGLYRLADGIWTPYGGRDDLPKTGASIIEFTDSLGRVWFGYLKNQLAVLDGERVRVFGPSDGLQVGAILAIHGRGSEIWIGGEFGLEQFDHGRFHNIQAMDDELLRGISGIVETANGDLWLNAISGIFHVRKAEISAALTDPNYRVKGEHFGRREGVPGTPAQLRPLPTAIEGTDGRLWFTFGNGVVWLDPAAYSEKRTVPPPITIQSVAADDKSYAPASHLFLPAHTSSVQISYSAVSLTDPEAIRSRYKLKETDKDWHEAAAGTPVTYRNLPPGSYHFSVETSDTNGAWSDAAATTEFTILPAFYQTGWFIALCVVSAVAFLYMLYMLRVRQLARQYGMRLEERVGERTRIARDLHDTLLQTFHGLLLRFQTVSQLLPARPEEAKQKLDNAIDQAAEAMTEGRDAVQGLRSSTVETNDLAVAIRTIGEELAADETNQSFAVFQVEVEGTPRNLQPILRDEVYRLAGEALRNAFWHAQARRIEVEIRYDEKQFRLRVRDDGKGIDPKVLGEEGREGHYGLHGMRERAKLVGGKVAVWSKRYSGTEVELTIPASIAYATATRRHSWLSEKLSAKETDVKETGLKS
jgi:signal transduction histidine kinase/ligand-binding sensor domain-containing protein